MRKSDEFIQRTITRNVNDVTEEQQISLEAIFLTLFVLTSQNRQRARIRSDIEFETSINTELKIDRLHEKVDKLTEEHYKVLENSLDTARWRAKPT